MVIFAVQYKNISSSVILGTSCIKKRKTIGYWLWVARKYLNIITHGYSVLSPDVFEGHGAKHVLQETMYSA